MKSHTSKLYLSLLLAAFMTVSAVASQTRDTCRVSDDCPDLHDCQANVCVHKELFPITIRELGGTIFILILNAIMTAGGVGPFIMLAFQHSLKQSIYMSYAFVFGGGIGNLMSIINLKDPKTNRYMTNWTLNMIILPALMIGVMTGGLLSRILAPLVITLILLCVLMFSTYKNFYSLRANLAKEKNQRSSVKSQDLDQLPAGEEAAPQEQEQEQEEEEIKIPATECGNKAFSLQVLDNEWPKPAESASLARTGSVFVLGVSKNETDCPSSQKELVVNSEKRELIIKREQSFPFDKLREVLINVIIIVVVGLIRGSKSFAPIIGVNWSCSWDFLWFGVAVVAFLLTLARSVYLVLKWQNEKIEVGYEFLPEEPLLDKPTITKLVVASIIAGIISALIGLGGCMILGPILLDMYIPPGFSAATTGVFMIFSMFNASYQTILDGRLHGQELAWFVTLSFIFSYISSKVVGSYVKKTGRQSITFMIGLIGAVLGFLCVSAIFTKTLVENFEAQVQFEPICE